MGLNQPFLWRFMRDTMGSTANLILGLSEMDLPPKYFQTKPYGSKLLKPKKTDCWTLPIVWFHWQSTFDPHVHWGLLFFGSWYPLNFVASYHRFVSFHVHVTILVSVQFMLGPVLFNFIMLSHYIPTPLVSRGFLIKSSMFYPCC